jgi:DNA-binding beta-propeller fold protein YncE
MPAVVVAMDRRGFLVASAALALEPRRLITAAATSQRPVVLATADLESRLVAVELRSGAILEHIPTTAYPRSIETVGNTAVVAHSDVGVVSLIDGATRKITHVLSDFGEPRYTAGHPDGRHAYVTDAKTGELVAIDIQAGKILAREPVGALARHISINDDGTRIWTALGPKAEQIATVDVSSPSRPRLLGHLSPPFLAHDVCWAPDGQHIWVSSGDSRALLIYTANGQLVARLPADAPPQHISFDRTTAYVTSGLSATLRRHSLQGKRLSLTRIPEGSYSVQYAHERVVTPALGYGSLCILDEAGTLLHRDQIANSSHDACIVTSKH